MSLEYQIIPTFSENPPDSPDVTEFDRQHFKIYLFLLDASDKGSDWRTSYQEAFDDNPDTNAEKSQAIYQSYLKRAKWMTANGYLQLL